MVVSNCRRKDTVTALARRGKARPGAARRGDAVKAPLGTAGQGVVRSGGLGLVRLAYAIACASLFASQAFAQVQAPTVSATSKATIGSSTLPSASSLRVTGLLTTGGDGFLLTNASGEAIKRLISKTDLPATIAYTDQTNVFSSVQTFSGGVNGTFSILGQTIVRANVPLVTTGLGFPNVRFGINATTPRVLWEPNGTGRIWEMDNADGALRYIQHPQGIASGIVEMSLDGLINVNPSGKAIMPVLPYDIDLGSLFRKFRSIHAAELWIETLVAQDTLATFGGRILTGTTTILLEAITDVATTIKVQYNNLAVGDRIYAEADGKVEFMNVTAGPVRINKDANASIEVNTAGYSSTGATLTRDSAFAYRGGYSLKWVSGAQTDVYRIVGEIVGSTQYTCSTYIRRPDGAKITTADVVSMACAASSYLPADAIIDAGGGWYRILQTQTSPASPAGYLGILLAAGTYYLDAWQIELGASATAWSANSASYTVARNQDNTGANSWDAGVALFNTGTIGSCWIDQYSIRGMNPAITQAGPTVVGNCRTGTTFNDWAPRWAIGNLNGLYGFSGTNFGAAFGNPVGPNITIDTDPSTGGVRINNGAVTKFYAAIDGSLRLTGDLIMGSAGAIRTDTATGFDTGTGYWLDYNSGTPRLRVGATTASGNPYFRWTGSDIDIKTVGMQLNSTVGLTIAANVSGSLETPKAITWIGGGSIYSQSANELHMQNNGNAMVQVGGSGSGAFVYLKGGGADVWQPYIRLVGGISGYTEYGGGTPGTLPFRPDVDNQYDFGAPSLRWRNIYFAEPIDNQFNLNPVMTKNGQLVRKSNVFTGSFVIGGNCTLTFEGGTMVSRSGAGCP